MNEPAHILVVEDEEASRKALDELLRLEGYEVETAVDGEEALDRFREARFDLVVSDVRMPRADGYELVARLRDEPAGRDIPVILLSALDDVDRRVRGLDLGADDYLSKPIDAEELLARVRAQLRRATRSQELRLHAVVDELTGVLNRRGVMEALSREWKRSDRTGSWLSALVLDVDDFKAVNDVHGHAAGDAVLVHVGRTLGRTLRAHDRVGRIGGDEFLVLLPETAPDEAVFLATRLRRELAGPVPLPSGAQLRLRVSVGVATARAADLPPDLVSRADVAMYRDKQRHHARRAQLRRPVDR